MSYKTTTGALALGLRQHKNVTMYFVYILECEDKSLYTGITTDMPRRYKEHQEGKGGHYTRSHRVKNILYTEKKRTRSSAQKREAEIKRLSRAKKILLIREPL